MWNLSHWNIEPETNAIPGVWGRKTLTASTNEHQIFPFRVKSVWVENMHGHFVVHFSD